MKILISTVVASFLFVACSQENSKKAQELTENTKAVTEKSIANVEAVTKETLEVTQKASDEVIQTSKELADKTVEVSKEIVEEATTATKKIVQKTKESVNEIAKDIVVATEDNGATLYKTCAGCHGVNGEKAALGKSQVIQGWSVSKLEHALNGYKDGSYGATMKAVMKGQASKLSDADIKAVSEYISQL